MPEKGGVVGKRARAAEPVHAERRARDQVTQPLARKLLAFRPPDRAARVVRRIPVHGPLARGFAHVVQVIERQAGGWKMSQPWV
jgi:hypothetical protein